MVAPYDPEPGESLAGFEPGDTVTARDAFYGLLVPSGNDAALTLALAVSGSESDFVARMNDAADELGLAETDVPRPDRAQRRATSRAPATWSISPASSESKSSSARSSIRRGSRCARRPSRSAIENRNALVLEEPFIDGIKTGTTVEAGYVLVASGTQKGIGLVSVVLGSPDEASRDSATLDLLDYGFSLYGERPLVKQGERLGFARLAEGGRLPLAAGASR